MSFKLFTLFATAVLLHLSSCSDDNNHSALQKKGISVKKIASPPEEALSPVAIGSAWPIYSYFAVNGKGYVINMESKLYEYDPNKNTWTKKSSFPGGSEEDIQYAMGFASGNLGYCVEMNFENDNDGIWSYSPETDEWTMLVIKNTATDFSITGSFFVTADGIAVGNGASTDLYKTTVQQNTPIEWQPGTSFPQKRAAMDFSIQGVGYWGAVVEGGGSTATTNEFWKYENNEWTELNPLPGEFQGEWGRIFVLGTKAYVQSYDALWIYNSTTDSWTKHEEIPVDYIQAWFAIDDTAYLLDNDGAFWVFKDNL